MAIRLSSVVLPLPLPPMIATHLPGRISTDTSWRICLYGRSARVVVIAGWTEVVAVAVAVVVAVVVVVGAL